LLFILGGCAAVPTSTLPELRSAAATITSGNLLRHIRELSSDEYEGRLPGTPGEQKSVAYLLSQIQGIGLQPGTPTGGFVQKVPLYGTRSRGTISITVGGKDIPMSTATDFALWSNLPEQRIEVRDTDPLATEHRSARRCRASCCRSSEARHQRSPEHPPPIHEQRQLDHSQAARS
jgi:hypothetical protein